jgi:hypothetical protein
VAARDAVSSPNRLAASSNLWSDETDALAGRADQQDGCPCHPADLPEGYHAATRGRCWRRSAGGGVEGRPRAAARSGCARTLLCRVKDGGGVPRPW